MIPDWPDRSCQTVPAMWDGERYADIVEAIDACMTCPALEACTDWTKTQTDLVGVVAGHPQDDATRRLFPRKGRYERRTFPAGYGLDIEDEPGPWTDEDGLDRTPGQSPRDVGLP